jgi:hypothetical protein
VIYWPVMRRRPLLCATATAAIAATVGSFGLCAGGALASTSHRARHAASPAAVTASAKLYLYDAFLVEHRTVDVPGRAISVSGYVSRYVPGQRVTLTASLGGRRVANETLRVRAAHGARSGRFSGSVTAPRAGILHLTVVHRRNRRMHFFTAGRGVVVVPTSSSSSLFTALVQQRLVARHLYLPLSGKWDLQTQLAIEAYHRLLGRGTSPALDPATLTALLDGQGSFTVRYPHNGRHAEGDLSDELLALVDGSKVQEIYPISSGKPSTPTILGNYRVYERTPGYLPDGMYYSDFFIRGYAIHGYDPAPNYPASHGCMRLAISDAISAFDWLAIGDGVDVYGVPNESV